MSVRVCTAVFLLGLGAARPAHAQIEPWESVFTLEEFNGAFGSSVAVNGDLAVVGARDAFARLGSASLLLRAGTWSVVEESTDLIVPDEESLGFSAALLGDVAVVGAPTLGPGFGAAVAFFFGDEGWGNPVVLRPESPDFSDLFGWAVALDGNRLAVGAPRGDGGPGAVTIYTRSGLGFDVEATLPSRGARGFGEGVALDGDRCLVGAPASAVALVFERTGSTWSLVQTINAPAATATLFGAAVALDGDRMLIGAWSDTGDDENGGAVYVYARGSEDWALEATLRAGGVEARFGRAVALVGDEALIGAPAATVGGRQAGAAYLYERGSSWTRTARFEPSDASSGDFFGRGVAFDGATLMVGAPGANTATIFERRLVQGDACTNDDECFSGFCIDGVCCERVCGGGSDSDCVACVEAQTGEADGTCAPLPAMTACGDSSSSECDGADACTAEGFCAPNLAASGTPCGDPTDNTCNGADTCDGAGTCEANLTLAGVPCGDATASGCDRPDSCDGAGACDPRLIAEGDACGEGPSDCSAQDTCDAEGACQPNHLDDGLACGASATSCTSAGTCESGACAAPPLPAGTPCGDATGTDCDGPDQCDGAGRCDPQIADDGTSCEALGFCVIEVCAEGRCAPTSDAACDAGLECIEEEAACKPLCGNGRIDGGEGCDEGAMNADRPNACRTDCSLPECGDGIVDLREDCDDGGANADAPDMCRTDCSLPTCGDGIVDEGEACDGGAECTADCAVATDADAGLDGGMLDGSFDGGPSDSGDGGCGCRAGSGAAPRSAWLFFALMAFVAFRRRPSASK
ncbi:MAG: MYXO-CTERM sorting domain-containing protein [Myxococcota bacterium]